MLDDACLVLLVGSDPSAVPRWVRRLRARGDRARLIVAYPSDAALDVAGICDEFPDVHRLPLADASDPEATLAAVVAAVPTPHFTITTLEPPTPDLFDGLAAALTARRHVAAVPANLPVPVLLWHHTTPVHLVTAYLERVVAEFADPPSGVSDYLGALALQAALVTVEWLDPRPGAVDIALRLNLAGHRFGRRPPWQFRVTVSEPDGRGVSGSDPVGFVERIDASGTTRWEWLLARVPLTGVPTGDYRIELSLTSPHESFRVSRTARPSKGVLANARTVRLETPGAGARTVRYYLHTPDHGRETRLRIAHGSGPLAELVWNARLTAADLRYILRGDGGRRMRALRLLKLLTTPLFLGREVWLVGERADEAQDNGVHLFRYLRAHPQRRRHVYYVLSRSSPQHAELRRLGHVVAHSSRRHQLLMLHAAVVANAHSTHHMVPWHWNRKAFRRRLAWRTGALQVFLQHGVHLSPEAVKRGNTGYDVILTSARGESRALRAVSGYDTQIAEVGMPRFDHLTPTPPSRTILMLPTWRRYIWSQARGQSGPDLDHYDGSTYERFMTGLLTSARLQAMLESFDYRLVLVPHHNIAEHLRDAATAGDRITVVEATGTEVQDMVRRCDVFMTDHSSVHFDAAYLGTPVIYARFDREEFESRHAAPSWFSFERDGFGPVATTVDGTLDELEALLTRGCTPDPRFAGRAAEVFAHRDQGNSRRVVATIDRRLRTIRTKQGGS